MYGYIYITTNLINNKKYIGKHKSKVFTEDYKGSGKLLIKAIEKYGIDNFKVELIEECDSLEELNEKEIYWIRYYDAVDSNMFYNLIKGGEGGSIKGRKLSESTKNKISISLSGNNAPWFGKKIPNNIRINMSKNHANFSGINNPNFGNNMSVTTKQKIRESMPDFTGENNPFYGKRHSEDTKVKISNNMKSRKWMNNGLENKFVNENDQCKLLESGWKFGMIRKVEQNNE